MRLLLALCGVLLARAALAQETIELIPDDRAGFSASNLLAPLAGLLRGQPSYYYRPRRVQIETSPPGGVLDLFYVRANFQKGYEQADAPVTVVLPSRVEAGPRDHLKIRALLDGYRQQEVQVPIRSGREEVQIDFAPLPNALLALRHVYLAGRARIEFLTQEALSFRVQESESGFQVVLTETALGPEAAETLAGVRSPLVDSLEALQLGEDLVVRVRLSAAARAEEIAPRSRQSFDPVRRLHSFGLDLVGADGGAGAVERGRAALARLRRAQVSGCAARFDEALRAELDPASLARALAAKGSFTDPYLRAAMRRLGELSPGGFVTLSDGTRYRVSVPIELMAAGSQAHEVQGYLALLRAFVAELEPVDHRHETLRGLVAPEVASARFEQILSAAEAREQTCRAS